ncbi:RHS repeat-associated core domain-containing protein [Pseudomonas japonica]|uniref:RHS repeat-associated core domain-containing protein n=1 Tax=Pseudomonas japonica TaxID=256466 RepID=UPI0015E31FB1|nr:RHS repeat-associated core domain-containing protein [Pseudomonas japonica]MBA1289628.1 RHS repeat-associated core domain-containing protein [Pseudomonas japonica]
MSGLVNNAAVLISTDLLASVSGTFVRKQKARWAYTPFGQGFNPVRCAIAFTGQRQESHGAYLLGNGRRLFSPPLMRFTSADNKSPFGKGGINSYCYCAGQPVSHSDPSGEAALAAVFVASTLGAAGLGFAAIALMSRKNNLAVLLGPAAAVSLVVSLGTGVALFRRSASRLHRRGTSIASDVISIHSLRWDARPPPYVAMMFNLQSDLPSYVAATSRRATI